VIKYAACLLSLAAAAATASGAEDLARCADIAAPDARLACYDALAHRPADATPSSGAVKPSAAAAAVKQSVGTAEKPSAAAAAASAAAISAQDPNNFGLSLAQQHMAFAGPTSIKARVEAINSGPNGQTYIVLDSGQTWTMGENDGWLSKGDAVTIKRAALGAFLLTAPSNHSYHVRRVH
jgi:phospholipase A1